MAEVGEFFLDHQVNHRDPVVLGNTDPWMVQDVLQVLGEDHWVAVSIRDDRDWAALHTVDGLGGATGLPAPDADGATRREHSAAIREVLADWCRDRTADDVVSTLQAVGIPAGEVLDERQVLDDPHLAERGWWQERSHPSVGTHRYPGHPWRSDDVELAYGRPLPGFGEDNEHVYLSVLGYDRETYDDLVARGLVTDHQLA